MLFKNVLVNEEIKRRLVTSVKENRISHAQLFLGQPGNHSFALAMAYARYICCENKGDWDSCGECPSCHKFDKLEHPDLHLVFPNSNTNEIPKDADSEQLSKQFTKFVLEHNYHISIEDWLVELGGENKQAAINIRDCANILYHNNNHSFEGGYKIFILWTSERLRHDAAPKLLKTLEEPENKTLFILLAEDSDKILATILSRTQLIKIPRLKQELIASQLEKDFHAPQNLCNDIAAISEGNYIQAIRYYNAQEELQKQLSRFDLLFNQVVRHAENNTAKNFLEVKKMFDELIKEGREVQKNFFIYVSVTMRKLLLVNTNNELLLKATESEKQLLEKFKNTITLKNISGIIEECNTAIFHIERNGNSSLIFTDFFLKLVSKIQGTK